MAVDITGSVKAGGFTRVVTASFQRPADTNQYTATDVVSNSTATTALLVFRDCVRVDGGTGIIYSALMLDSVDAATNPNFDLALFDSPNLTLAADNATGTVTDFQLPQFVAAITFDGTNASNVCTVGPNLVIGATSLGLGFQCAQGSRTLYGVVIDRGGYTPASGEFFTFKLCILAD